MNFLQEWELFWVVDAMGDNVIDNIRDAFVIEVNQDLQRNFRKPRQKEKGGRETTYLGLQF